MLSLEPPKIADTENIWRLRNDVATRRELGLVAISYSECLDWVANIIDGKQSDFKFDETLLLARDDKLGIVGLVILEKASQNLTYIKVSIVSAIRGNGYGRQAIKLANDYAKEHGINKLIAEIRGENYKALFAFEENGYIEMGTFTRGPSKTEYFTYEWKAE